MRLLRKQGDVPKRSLWQRIKDIALMDVAVLARGGVSAGSLEQLEQMLLEADFGVPVTLRLVEEVERLAQARPREDARRVPARRSPTASSAALRGGKSDPRSTLAPTAPTVILVVGVNGAGKTTFIGKLSAQLRAEKKARDGRRGRHVPRRRDRSAARVGRAHRRRVRRRARRAPIRRRRVRRDRRRRRARRRRLDRRHGGAPAHERRLDGRAQEGRARHRQAAARRAARDAARARRHHRAERRAAGEDLLRARCRCPASS